MAKDVSNVVGVVPALDACPRYLQLAFTDRLAFVSAQIGRKTKTADLPADPYDQLDQALTNLELVLRQAEILPELLL
jgi:enamine deaminase RidA (YjgF/YER057c/UK114 family)